MWRSGTRDHDSSESQQSQRETAPGKVTRSERISRRANGGAVTADPDAAVASTAGSHGSSLPDGVRGKFEASLGTDLSSVRVHTGESSASAAQGLGARAFAVGQDIHFGAGQYQPDDPFGMHLLAHEVAHTVQQAGGGPRMKLEVSAPGDSFEAEADRAADAMVSGAPAVISSGAPQISRQVDGAAPTPANGDDKAAMPVFVEFSKDGKWDAQQVLATLQGHATVPQELQAAILEGPRATAIYCVALRDKISATLVDPAREEEVERITAALTTRRTELFYATSRSPLQYRQLAEVAEWGNQYGGGVTGAEGQHTSAQGGAGDPAVAAKPGGEKAQAHANAAAESFATKLSSEAGARIRQGDKDQIRDAKFQSNDAHQGSESGDAALNGWTFLRDPFDNTVTAVRPDGTGLQFTFLAEGTPEAPKLTLIRTLELSKLRVGALKRQDQMAPGEAQEGPDGPAKRRAQDKANGDAARKQFRIDHPAEMSAYDDAMKKWKEDGSQGNPPSPPKGYPTDKQTTSCPLTPNDVYKAADPAAEGFFPFSPQTQWKSWRTLAKNPEGPSPGDVYYLWDNAKSWVAHMGVFKSAAPVPGTEDLWTWTVTDGGQGGYASIQQNQERTRGPFNKKTGIFSSSIAEAGQQKGDRKLYGWVDIDAFRANPEKVPDQKDAKK